MYITFTYIRYYRWSGDDVKNIGRYLLVFQASKYSTVLIFNDLPYEITSNRCEALSSIPWQKGKREVGEGQKWRERKQEEEREAEGRRGRE